MPRHRSKFRATSCNYRTTRSMSRSYYSRTRETLPSIAPTKRLRVTLAGEGARLRESSLPLGRSASPTRGRKILRDERARRKNELIRNVCRYLRSELGFALPHTFYSEWSSTPSQSLVYLYVSCKDRVQQPEEFAKEAASGRPYRGFGTSTTVARAAEEQWKSKIFDTLVYYTVASRSSKITDRLLQYEDPAIVFVVAHEALHVHLRMSRVKIPYEYEEALADWVGLQVVRSFSKRYHEIFFNTDEAAEFVQRMERFHALICEALSKEVTSAADLESAWNRSISAERNRLNAPSIFLDRFDFPVSNKAFLLRYSAYCAKYFLLKSVFGDVGEGIETAFGTVHRWLKRVPSDSSTIENELLNRLAPSVSEALTAVSLSRRRALNDVALTKTHKALTTRFI
ncbi:hypothetical protein FOZ60_008705 [Perkinsus olseni]|uniref:Uncharacterized protein n=1 Tax=Perkinsus olseni TaxID=32597 RepID=A0A7J6PDG1_PEROL|nr:hypothetical protein FOZ60_008705 [Perkinsus olseni]